MGAVPVPQVQEQIVDKAADVPVTMHDQVPAVRADRQWFVPQIQFIDRVLDIHVMPQRQVRTVPNCAELGRPPQRSSWVGC